MSEVNYNKEKIVGLFNLLVLFGGRILSRGTGKPCYVVNIA